MEQAERFGVLPTEVLDADERLMNLFAIERYGRMEEAS